MNAFKRYKSAKKYAAKCNLLTNIHKAIAPALQAMRNASDLLDRCTRTSNGIEAQGYCCLVGDKYAGHVYSTGTMESDLAKVNDTWQGVRAQASNQARRDTYQASK